MQKQQLAYLNTCNLDHEHCGPKHMASVVAPEFDSSNLRLLVKVNGLNAVHACFDVLLSVKHLVCSNVAHFNVV